MARTRGGDRWSWELAPAPPPARMIDRYVLGERLAAGGMGGVHLGHLVGSAGFRRVVAIKRLHEKYATDPTFVRAFVEEARIAARIRHPNVVPTLDVILQDGELFLVMEYVHGEALHRLMRPRRDHPERVPARIIAAVARDLLEGLHAAHSTVDAEGRRLGIVHRDVSPQNVLVGTDGLARVADFGLAVATGRLRGPGGIGLEGKLQYMAPEQILGGEITPRTDVFAASVILWEGLTGTRLFPNGANIAHVLEQEIPEPRALHPMGVPVPVSHVVMRGLARNPALRYATAREMAVALERAITPATDREVGAWVEAEANKALMERAACVARIERDLEPDPPAESEPGILDGGDTISTHTDPDGLRDVLESIFNRKAAAPAEEPEPQRWSATAWLIVTALVIAALVLFLVRSLYFPRLSG